MDFSAEPLNDPTSGESGHIVRELLLGRRRSRVPWVYMVYNRHARNKVRAVFAKRHHSRSQQEHGGIISAM